MYKSESVCCSLAIQLQGLKLEVEVVEKNTLEESKDNTGTWEGPGAGSSYHVSIVLGHKRGQFHLRGRGGGDGLFQGHPASSVYQTGEQSRKSHHGFTYGRRARRERGRKTFLDVER